LEINFAIGKIFLAEFLFNSQRLNMARNVKNNYETRSYMVVSVAQAKNLAKTFLTSQHIDFLKVKFGLPEVDDRYHVWRIPILDVNKDRLGELVIDARTGEVDVTKSSEMKVMLKKLASVEADVTEIKKTKRLKKPEIQKSIMVSTIIQGDAESSLAELPTESIDLVFTSPPYFNARPDYSEYEVYEEYLHKMRQIIRESHRLLADGRFFVINVSPVLIRRANRSESSKRIAVPFDLHRLFIEEGFDFIDDIIWEKPSGAGWATGRGRRFAADRTPLQYKAVPVTEYVLVYRKSTPNLIDWNIRNHPDQEAVKRSKVGDDYERTNIWKVSPSHSKDHPAIFPDELADRVIKYYSFENDVVLDPFAGSGTVGRVAYKLKRRFVLSELDPTYIEVIKSNLIKCMRDDVKDISCVNTSPITPPPTLF
jgi:DNA modification methylase